MLRPDLEVLRAHVLTRRGNQVSDQKRRSCRGGNLPLVGTRRPREHGLALPGRRLSLCPGLLALVAIKADDRRGNAAK